jgi:hypothetical protein
MPAHNSIHEGKPGKCPICGMTLIPVMEAPPPPGSVPQAPTGSQAMPGRMAMPEPQH